MSALRTICEGIPLVAIISHHIQDISILLPSFLNGDQCKYTKNNARAQALYAFFGNVEDKFQRLQWVPRLSPWRLLRVCDFHELSLCYVDVCILSVWYQLGTDKIDKYLSRYISIHLSEVVISDATVRFIYMNLDLSIIMTWMPPRQTL